MFANQSEFHALPEEDDLEEYEAETDEDDIELFDGDDAAPEEGDDELLVSAAEDDDSEPESSLDELLARRAAKAALEGEEEARLADLASLLDDGPAERRVEAVPPKRPEFVCASCRLVKPSVQLSDRARSLCRDCA